MAIFKLAHRSGHPPDNTRELPHSQLMQPGSDEIVQKLHKWRFSLLQVANEHSKISVPGARALVLHEGTECNHQAFMVG